MVELKISEYAVFLSHSGQDQRLLSRTMKIIQLIGAVPYISAPGEHPGSDVDPTTRKLIDRSNGVVVLLTKSGCQSQSVNQEIGYAKGKKPILPVLIEGETMPGIFLHGNEPLPIKNDDWESVIQIGEAIIEAGWNVNIPILTELANDLIQMTLLRI